MSRTVAGIIALTIYASRAKVPFYTGKAWRNDGRFDANEVKKARKSRKKKRKK